MRGVCEVDLDLHGRTAVVIGGSSGIGADVAGVLAEEGCDVAVTYRSSPQGAEEAAAVVRAHGRRAWVAPLDLSCTRAGGSGRSGTGLGPRRTRCPRALRGLQRGDAVQPDLRGRVGCGPEREPHRRLLRPAVDDARDPTRGQHRHGGQRRRRTPAPRTRCTYAAAKAGLVNLTRSLARELAPQVRVNCRRHPASP